MKNNKFRSKSSHFHHILTLLIVTLIFFHPIVFQGEVFFFGDTLLQRIPSMVFWKQQILSGQLPLWNPYIFAGQPHLADLSTNTLSPFNFAYLFINNPFTALSHLVVFQVFLSAIFTYFFLISLKLSKHSSLFGAIAFAFSGTTLAAANDINSLQSIILLPLVLLTASNLVAQPTLRNSVVVSFALILQFISGHPQYSYYTWVFLFAYLFTFLSSPLINKLKLIAVTFALFLGLSSTQLLPFLELSSHAYRPTSTDFSSQNSLKLLDLPRFILADIYGNWTTGSSWGPDSPLETGRANTEGFVGLTTLLLASIALIKVKTKPPRFFAVIAILSILLALGPATPLFYFSRSVLPFFSKFRSPIRILSLYTFSISVLSAYGLNWIISKNPHAKSK